MDITYLGHSSFKLKGKSAILVTDPYGEEVGFKFPKKVEASIVTVSHDHKDHSAISLVEGTPYVVSGPGEYEISGVGVLGFPTYHDKEKGALKGKNTMYRIEMDGLVIVHLGDLGHTLSSSDVDALGSVDILCIAVGATALSLEEVQTCITEIDPSIVLPMHYNTPSHNQKIFGTLGQLAPFLKQMGKESIEPVGKLTMTKDKLPEEMQIVVLSS
ncbi:MBL fold metallo-hydrolase [Candidatus Gottesmanbacteria bacterium]|nr:MBL fold metallo-hydrolase [Candidatus Gottesmanbacteria bacterium]